MFRAFWMAASARGAMILKPLGAGMQAIVGQILAEKAVGVNHGAEVIEVDTAVGGAVRG